MINPSKLDQFNPEQEEKYEAVGEERYTAEPQGPNSAQRSNSRTLSTGLVIAMCFKFDWRLIQGRKGKYTKLHFSNF